MSTATLGGVPLDIDPEAVAWTYDIKISSVNTVGGKVVQAFGTSISEIVVEGSFGTGSTAAQKAFFNQVETWIADQVGTLTAAPTGQGVYNGTPLRFTFPYRNWDFQVYITRYYQPGEQAQSVVIQPTTVNYRWGLALFVYANNGTLAQETDASMISYVNQLGTTFGWYPNDANGPVLAGQYPTLTPLTPAGGAG